MKHQALFSSKEKSKKNKKSTACGCQCSARLQLFLEIHCACLIISNSTTSMAVPLFCQGFRMTHFKTTVKSYFLKGLTTTLVLIPSMAINTD